MFSVKDFNERGRGKLPGLLDIEALEVGERSLSLSMPVTEKHMAPNGYLHAGAVVTLADSAAGYGCIANLPEGATGFTTIELKSNHLGTARDGTLDCTARLVHGGRTTQVWDATVTHRDTGKTIAVFRCTQLLIYPR